MNKKVARFLISFPINVNESLIPSDMEIKTNKVYSSLKVLVNCFAILISIIKKIVPIKGTK